MQIMLFCLRVFACLPACCLCCLFRLVVLLHHPSPTVVRRQPKNRLSVFRFIAALAHRQKKMLPNMFNAFSRETMRHRAISMQCWAALKKLSIATFLPTLVPVGCGVSFIGLYYADLHTRLGLMDVLRIHSHDCHTLLLMQGGDRIPSSLIMVELSVGRLP